MDNKKNIYISAIYTSPPNSMGGNTKISLELINALCDEYQFTIFTTEPETFKKNIKNIDVIKIIEVPLHFRKFSLLTHYKEVKTVFKFLRKYFLQNEIKESDYFYSTSDFAPDVLPIYWLKKQYDFKWIASLYLFIPNPIENLVKKYGFPFLKYVVYFFYQKFLFKKILNGMDLCLITNDIDKKNFPKKKQDKVLAIYGGVNINEIEKASEDVADQIFDAVFCSRLHPQKGVSSLLDIWAMVAKKLPDARLAIIGNGDESYEKFLKEKALKLGLEKNISWLGYINGVEKFKIYNQSKVFLHATIYDNNGMVAAEALCSGLPVIMYNLKSFRELYTDGCLKIKEGRKQEFAYNILRLLTDSDFYSKIKPDKNIIDRLRDKWKWENKAEVFKNFLKQNEEAIT
ncbi:MAG: glycosyltransferase family 4 protein [Patescibacteria group bacterium]|nr:glycosyltransferase family 4 protein [Patescibacteria group bacterium]